MLPLPCERAPVRPMAAAEVLWLRKFGHREFAGYEDLNVQMSIILSNGVEANCIPLLKLLCKDRRVSKGHSIGAGCMSGKRSVMELQEEG